MTISLYRITVGETRGEMAIGPRNNEAKILRSTPFNYTQIDRVFLADPSTARSRTEATYIRLRGADTVLFGARVTEMEALRGYRSATAAMLAALAARRPDLMVTLGADRQFIGVAMLMAVVVALILAGGLLLFGGRWPPDLLTLAAVCFLLLSVGWNIARRLLRKDVTIPIAEAATRMRERSSEGAIAL